MKNKIFGAILAVILVASIVSASLISSSEKEIKEEISDSDYSIETYKKVSYENGLERIDYIHFKKPKADKFARTKPARPRPTACYKLLGYKWKTLPVNYVINPTNPDSLSEGFVTGAVSSSAETWDSATISELFNDAYIVDYSENYGERDYKNVISFGDYPQEGVIGVTSIWATRFGKQIVEFDILLDTDFSWGDALIDSSKMDLQNIAVHELGHGIGLDDIYSGSCSEVTMFGYSGYGETKKRSLETPDITGIRSLYG